jgi:DNA replicative helicase MCM subunit Mcm2 (Cdc46/Mcm family)
MHWVCSVYSRPFPPVFNRQGNDVDVRQQVCPKDSFAILPEKCRCVDQQTLKLQESHDMIPVGELPRQVLLTVDRYLHACMPCNLPL